MKLRISGQSVRIRVLRSDVAELLADGRIEERIVLGPDAGTALRYVLAAEPSVMQPELMYQEGEIAIVLPKDAVEAWAKSEQQVGIYGKVKVGEGKSVELIVEKDFACLDLSDAENKDTFPNPEMGGKC